MKEMLAKIAIRDDTVYLTTAKSGRPYEEWMQEEATKKLREEGLPLQRRRLSCR